MNNYQDDIESMIKTFRMSENQFTIRQHLILQQKYVVTFFLAPAKNQRIEGIAWCDIEENKTTISEILEKISAENPSIIQLILPIEYHNNNKFRLSLSIVDDDLNIIFNSLIERILKIIDHLNIVHQP